MLKFLLLTAVTLISIQSFADPYGMYHGFINMSPDVSRGIPNGRKTPISIALKQTDSQITPVNPSNAFQQEKKVEGSFVIDDECGPFGFSSSDYDLETGKLILQYARLGNTGAASSIINLRIQCTRHTDGTCDGTVSGVDGQIGTISLVQDSPIASTLQAIPKYVGIWDGTITYTPEKIALRKIESPTLNKPASEEFNFYLSVGGNPFTNPDFYEINTTPPRAGSDYEGGANFVGTAVPYSSIYIDYLRGTAKLTALSPFSGNTGTETLVVQFNQDANGKYNGTISGTMFNSKTPVGNFIAKQVQ